MIKEYKAISDIAGPIVIAEGIEECSNGELAELYLPDGSIRHGEILVAEKNRALIQMFEGTEDLNLHTTRIRFKGKPAEVKAAKGKAAPKAPEEKAPKAKALKAKTVAKEKAPKAKAPKEKVPKPAKEAESKTSTEKAPKEKVTKKGGKKA